MRDIKYTNNPFVIAQNPHMKAINSATEVDLTGQICADSIGTRIFSGTGGQLEFVRGASMSEGGKEHHRLRLPHQERQEQDRGRAQRRRGSRDLARTPTGS